MSHDSDGDNVGGGVRLPSSPTTSRLDLIPVPQKVKRPPLTHFLSIPLHHAPDLEASLDILANDISTHFPSLSIPTGAMRPAQAAHLTLGVMSLTSEEMVERATELLKSMDMKALLQGAASVDHMARLSDAAAPDIPLLISLRGLATMGSPKKASVLYTVPHDPTNRLLPFAGAIQKCFTEEGLIVDTKRDFKLHLTLLNTVYAKKGGRKSKERLITLDLGDLVEKFGEKVFVDCVAVNRITICLMGAKEKDGVKGAGGYEEVFGITL